MFNLLKRQIHLAQPLRESISLHDQIIEALASVRKKAKTQPYQSRYIGRVKKRHLVDLVTEENPEKPANFNPEDRVKRKKCCVLFGYCGANYFGMQRHPNNPNYSNNPNNPDFKTIEGELMVAMLKQKWITENAFQLPQQVQFQRAARTDTGVSAARQCISMELPDDLDISAINKELPADIQIFGVKRVTKGFSAWKDCNARTYSYTLPTISFADHGQDVSMETYRLPNEKFVELNRLLKMFLGLKNFHNFTWQKHFIDPSSRRHIVSFVCSEPFVDATTNIEFAVMKINGHSFMLHQIRKMIGLTLAIIRGLTTSETLTRALKSEQINLPMAPGLGLVLDQVHYYKYDSKYGTDGVHEPLDWLNEEEQVKRFFDEHIFPTIVKTEMAEKSMVNWLETLSLHTYEFGVESTDNKSSDEKKTDITVEL